MLITALPIFLLPLLASVPALASNHMPNAAPIPRSLDAVLVEAREPAPSPSPSHSTTPTPTPTPHIQHLDLRQVAAGAGGAGNVAAPAQPAAVAPAAAAAPAEVDPTDSPTVAAGGAASATPVKSGAIGMGTLTGKVGVVNTKDAKNGAGGRDGGGAGVGVEVLGVLGCWAVAAVVGGGWLGVGVVG